MLIDEFLPDARWSERHSITIDAHPEVVYRAVRDLTWGEVPLFYVLMGIRSFTRFKPRRRILDDMIERGFRVLAEEVPREFVAGIVGKFWTFGGGVHSLDDPAREFRHWNEPGYAKGILNFTVESVERGCLLTTETRVVPTDSHAEERFSYYWAVVRPLGGLIRRAWLQAVKKRAEGSVPSGR